MLILHFFNISLHFLLIFIMNWKNSFQSELNFLQKRHLQSNTNYYTLGHNYDIPISPNYTELNSTDQPTGVSTLSNGDIIVIWEHKYQLNLNNYSMIYGQILSGIDLSKKGDSIVISTLPTTLQNVPSVDTFKTGGFVVVWQNLLTNYVISCRIFYDNSAQNMSDQFICNQYLNYNHSKPKVLTLDFPSFIVVWANDLQDGDKLGIFGNVFNYLTAQYPSDKQLNSYFNNSQDNPNLCMLKNGTIVITWHSKKANGTNFDQIMNFFDQNLLSLTNEFVANTYNLSSQMFGSVVTLSNDNFINVWMSWNNAIQLNQLKGQIFSFNSSTKQYNFEGSEFMINTLNSGIYNISYPLHSVIPLSKTIQGFMVIYVNSGIKTYPYYYQIFDLYGSKIGITEDHYENSEYRQLYSPLGAELVDGSFIIIWPSIVKNSLYLSYVFCKRYDITTNLLINNSITIKQGQMIKLSTTELDFKVIDFVEISQIRYCKFEIYENSGVNIRHFSRDQIANGKIFLYHNGGFDAPSIVILGKRFGSNTLIGTTSINFQFINLSLDNSYSISLNILTNGDYGKQYELNSNNLQISCIQSCGNKIFTFFITFSSNGHFEDKSNKNFHLKSFTQTQIQNQQIIFLSDTIYRKPLYILVATDGTTVSNPSTVLITFPEKFQTPLFISEFRITTDVRWDHFTPVVTANSNGDYALVWESDGQDGSGAGIYLRFIDKYSNMVTDEMLVNNYTYSSQCCPASVYDSKDRLIIVWLDYDQGTIMIKVYFNGSSDFFENNYGKKEQSWWGPYYNDLDYNDNDEFVVVWQSADNQVLAKVYTITRNIFINKTDEKFIHQDSEAHQEYPAIVFLNDGTYIVVWQERNNTSGYNIKIKFPNRELPEVVNSYRSDQIQPKIVKLNDEGYFVVWQSNDQDGDGYGIFGRKYFANGSKNGEEFQINSFYSGNQQNPRISYNTKDEIIVVWDSDIQDGSYQGIFGQKFDYLLQKVGYEFQVNKYTQNAQTYPSVAINSEGCYFVVWQSFGQDAVGAHGIYGNQFCFSLLVPQMVKVNSEFNIIQGNILYLNDYVYNYFGMGVQSTQDNEYLIVWSYMKMDPSTKKYLDLNMTIYAQILDQYSNKIREDFMISLKIEHQYSYSYFPDLGVSLSKSFVVVWVAFGEEYDSDGEDIYGRCYNSAGNPLNLDLSINSSTSIFRINNKTSGNQNYPRIAMNKIGQFVVVWLSWGPVSTVSGQLFAPNCSKINQEFIIDDITINYNFGNVAELNVDMEESGDFIVVWKITPTADSDISYFQQFHSSGGKIGNINQISGSKIFDYYGSKIPSVKYFKKQNAGFVLSWTNYQRDGYFHGIFSQIFDSNGNPTSNDSQVNTYFLHDQKNSDMVTFDDNSYLVVWTSSGEDGDGASIAGQLFSSTGIKVESEFLINTKIVGDQYFPTVRASSKDNIIVTYTSTDYIEDFGILAQKYKIINSLYQSSSDSGNSILGVTFSKASLATIPIDFALSKDEIYMWVIDIHGNFLIFDRKLVVDTLIEENKVFNFFTGQLCCMVRYENYLYIANTKKLLFIVNVTDPENPNLINNIVAIQEFTKTMYISKNILYIAFAKLGVDSYDISIPDMPKVLEKQITREQNILKMTIFNEIAYFVMENNMNLISMSLVTKVAKTFNLNSLGYSIEISKNGFYALVGTDDGMIIINLNTSYVVSFLQMDSIFYLKLSNDGALLSVCSKKYHLLYDTTNYESLNLLENNTFLTNIQKSLISNDNKHIIIQSDGVYLLKIITVGSENIIPSLMPLGKLLINDTTQNSLCFSDDESILFIADGQNLTILDMKNMNSSSFTIKNKIIGFGNVNNLVIYSNKLYVINITGLHVWEISEYLITHKFSYKIDSPIDLILSHDFNDLFVLTSINLLIFKTVSLTLVSTVGFTFSYGGNAFRMSLFSADKFLLISCLIDGIFLVDLRNISNINYTSFYLEGEITDVDFIEKNNSSLILLTMGNNFNIYEFYQLSMSILLISQSYIAQHTNSLKVISKNYVIFQSSNVISLVQISNPQRPVIFKSIKLYYNNYGYRFIHTQNCKYLVFPSMEIIGLYQSESNIYPTINMYNFNEKKAFDINIWGSSLSTGNSISNFFKILEIQVQPKLPSWISIQKEIKLISLFPLNLEDLNIFTESIVMIKISKQINSKILISNEITQLKNYGLLDLDLFPTNVFDPNNNELTNNQKHILSSHIFMETLVFPLNVFLELNHAPHILISADSQFKSKISPNSILIVSKKLDFQLINTFQDFDLDKITYSVDISGPHDWLTFDAQTTRFYGTPTKNEKNHTINVTIIASDGYVSTNDSFSFFIYKSLPKLTLFPDLMAANIFNAKGTISYEIPISFSDIDEDPLTYDVKLVEEKNSSLGKIDWSYDDLRNILKISGDSSNIQFFKETKFYYQEFSYNITARNIADDSVSSNFTVIFQNSAPVVNINNSLQSQFNSKASRDLSNEDLLVGISFEMPFSQDSFIDNNINSTLTYTSTQSDGSLLPEWIKFDQINFKFIFSPSQNELNSKMTITVTANNGVQKTSSSFIIRVKASWILILKMAAAVFGPFLGLLGVFKKRSTIYMYLFKGYYKFKRVEIYIDQPFIRDFYFIDAYLEDGEVLLREIMKNKLFMKKENLTNVLLSSKGDKELTEMLKNIRLSLKKEENSKDCLIDPTLLFVGHTLFKIVEGFLLEKLLDKYDYVKIIYNQMKNELKAVDMNSWYSSLVEIKDNPKRNFKYKLFPLVGIKETLVKERILIAEKKLKKGFIHSCYNLFVDKYKNRMIGSTEMSLIFAMLGKDALGIPSSRKRWYHPFERAKGESILLPANKVREIKCKKVIKTKNNWNGKMKTFFNCNYKDIEASGNKKLPPWLEYEITLGVLRFSGDPSEFDKDLLVIQIIDNNDMMVKEFEINIIQKDKLLKHINSKKDLTQMQTKLTLRDKMRLFLKEDDQYEIELPMNVDERKEEDDKLFQNYEMNISPQKKDKEKVRGLNKTNNEFPVITSPLFPEVSTNIHLNQWKSKKKKLISR